MMNLQKALAVVMTLAASQALAQAAMDAEKAERCATRLSISITGKAPSSTLMGRRAPRPSTRKLMAMR